MTPPIQPPGGRNFGEMLGDGMKTMWHRVKNIPNDSKNNYMLWGLGALGAIFGLMSGEGLLGMIMFALLVPLAVQALGGFAEGMAGRQILPGQRRADAGGGRQVVMDGTSQAPSQHVTSLPPSPQVTYSNLPAVPPQVVASLDSVQASRITADFEARGLPVNHAAQGQPVRPNPSPTVAGTGAPEIHYTGDR